MLCTEIYVEHSPEVSPRRVYVDCYRAAEIDMKTFKVNIAGVLSLSSLQFTCVFVVDLLFKALQEKGSLCILFSRHSAARQCAKRID